MPLNNGRCEVHLYVPIFCLFIRVFRKTVWLLLTMLFCVIGIYITIATTYCLVSWLMLLSLLTCYCVKLVFLAPTYKLGASWKAIKYQLFYDENFPARPFESKVLLSCISIISLNDIYASLSCVYMSLLYLMSGFWCVCAFLQGERSSTINWKWFPVLGMHHMNDELLALLVMCFTWRYFWSLKIAVDGHKCTTLVHHQRIHL